MLQAVLNCTKCGTLFGYFGNCFCNRINGLGCIIFCHKASIAQGVYTNAIGGHGFNRNTNLVVF